LTKEKNVVITNHDTNFANLQLVELLRAARTQKGDSPNAD